MLPRTQSSCRRSSRTRTTAILAAAAGAVTIVVPPQRARADLIHRYSFTTDATDSIGTASGTAVGAITFSGGQAVFPGSNTAYIQLPNNVLPTAAGSSTSIEVWGTYATTGGNFERIFDFGSGTTNYFFATPKTATDARVRFTISGNANEQGPVIAPSPFLGTTAASLMTVTFDGAAGVMSLYRNGAILSTAAVSLGLNQLAQAAGKNYIGHSQFAADPGLLGSMDEFRIHDAAIAPARVLLNATLGPDVTDPSSNNTWTLAGSSGDYALAGNWSNAHAPQVGELAQIDNAGVPIVSVSATNATQLRIVNGSFTVSNGATFTALGGIDLAPGDAATANTAAINVVAGGVLVTPALFADSRFSSTNTASKSVNFDNGTLRATATLILTGSNLTMTLGPGGGTLDTNGNTVTYGAAISGGGALTKIGTGTLFLTGANTFTGALNLKAGTLNFATGSLGSATAVTFTGGTLQYGASNTTDLTAGRAVTVGAGGVTVDTAGNSPTWTGGLTGPAAGALTKTGLGTLTFSGTAALTNLFVQAGGVTLNNATVTTTAFSDTGQLNGNSGTLTVKGASSLTVGADFNVSDANVSTGTLFIQDTAAIAAKTFYVGKSGSSVGAVKQTGGSIINTASPGDWHLGGGNGNVPGDANSVGVYDLAAGSFTTSGNFQPGAAGRGQFNLSGGTATVGGTPSVGRYPTGVGVLNVTGGIFRQTNAAASLVIGEQGVGTLNVNGTGVVSTSSNAASLRIALNGGTGNVNLGVGGTLAATAIVKTTGTANFNFHGGTLRALASSTTFMQGLDNAFVYSEGAVFDTNGFTLTVAQNLIAPVGFGINGIGVATSGANYAATPIALITGGGGTGAAAIPVLDGSGHVTGFTVTNPGVGYTAAATVTLVGGNPTTAATGFTVTNAANVSGGLTKLGAGTLTLSGSNNTYAGLTLVSAGQLTVAPNGALGLGNVQVAGGTTSSPVLELDNAASIADNATLTLSAAASGSNNAIVYLNFSGTEVVGTLVVGTTTLQTGVYDVNSPELAGYIDPRSTGSLQVVPEPATFALAMLPLALLGRRRRRRAN